VANEGPLVFVSAVSSELGNGRDLVSSDLRARGITVKVQQDFRQEPGSDTTLAKLHDYIEDCTAVVCVIGHRSGAIPPPAAAARFADVLPPGLDRASYTQWELLFARHCGRPLFLYHAADAYVPDRPLAPGDDDDADLQARFVTWLFDEVGLDRGSFSNVDELGRLVLRVDWDSVVARPVGRPDPEVVRRHTEELLATFRLDSVGISVAGASGHTKRLADAYTRTRYEVNGDACSLEDLISSRPRLVVLGGPGTGKTVSLKRLLTDAAQHEAQVPFYLRLADYGTSEGYGTSASGLISAIAARAAQLGVPELDERGIRWLISSGEVMIALDGFDEVGRVARDRLAGAIAELSDESPAIRLIVASRPDEYATSPLPGPTVEGVPDFAIATVLPLDDEDVRRFLHDSFDDDGRMWTTIRFDEDLRELARTPLLLTLIGLLGQRGTIPARDVALYDEVVKTAIETWESAKGGDVLAARGALEELSLAMHQREAPAAPLPLSSAVDVVHGDAPLIDWLVERTGLLLRHEEFGARRSRSVVQVAHLQLQEYLTGSALAHRLASDDEAVQRDGRALTSRWGSDPGWAEPQRFAAAELARGAKPSRLEEWITRRMAHGEPSAQEPADVVLTARMLAEADAEFLPATAAESEVVGAIAAARSTIALADRVSVLCALAPRPASMEILRQVALQTAEGVEWIGRGSPLPGSGYGSMEERSLAACMLTLCDYGALDDRRRVVEWVEETAPRLSTMSEWARFAPRIDELHGSRRGRAFLESITFSDQWLMDVLPVDVVPLLDTIEITSSADLARQFALTGAARSPHEVATAGFVEWLERQGDDEAFAACDRYYERLRATIAGSDPDATWAYHWQWQPLWPARDSAAGEALRREALRHRHIAWHVLRHAIHDPDYADLARPAWLSIVTSDPDRSRCNGLVYDMLHDDDTDLAVPLLSEALRTESACLWYGEGIVDHLVDLRRDTEVRDLLTSIEEDTDATPSHRALARSLIERVEARNP
jgi:hypothetical protein